MPTGSCLGVCFWCQRRIGIMIPWNLVEGMIGRLTREGSRRWKKSWCSHWWSNLEKFQSKCTKTGRPRILKACDSISCSGRRDGLLDRVSSADVQALRVKVPIHMGRNQIPHRRHVGHSIDQSSEHAKPCFPPPVRGFCDHGKFERAESCTGESGTAWRTPRVFGLVGT